MIDKILNLPDHVLDNGEFCVTRKGDKQPYDPIKNRAISANDTFYHIGDLLEFLPEYDVIGLKIGNGISALDIDDCIVNGVVSELANILIDSFKSYTEISPSGTGIRILFEAANKFDRDIYYIKNTKLNLEYYDGDDQERNGGRMVRLTGNNITSYKYRRVDTSKILERFMKRSVVINRDYISDTEYDPNFVKIVSYLLKYRLDTYEIYHRDFVGSSESDWDMMFLNRIGHYTDNKQEIEEIFETTKYFKTKSDRHSKKWNNGLYKERTMNMLQPVVELFVYDRKDSPEEVEPNMNMIYQLAVEYGVTKAHYFRKYKIVHEKMTNQDRANQLLNLSKIKGIRRRLKEYFESII